MKRMIVAFASEIFLARVALTEARKRMLQIAAGARRRAMAGKEIEPSFNFGK